MIGLNSYCMFQFYFGSTLPWVLSQFLSHRVGSIWSYLIYDFQMSTNGTNSKTLGIPPFNSKPIEGKVWIDRVGYVPGESIIVSGHVVNKTGKRMRATKIRLVEVHLLLSVWFVWTVKSIPLLLLSFQIVVFRAQCQTHVNSRTIAEISSGEFGQSYNWDRVPIHVPPVAPSGLPHCSIINVAYRIQVLSSFVLINQNQKFENNNYISSGND